MITSLIIGAGLIAVLLIVELLTRENKTPDDYQEQWYAKEKEKEALIHELITASISLELKETYSIQKEDWEDTSYTDSGWEMTGTLRIRKKSRAEEIVYLLHIEKSKVVHVVEGNKDSIDGGSNEEQI